MAERLIDANELRAFIKSGEVNGEYNDFGKGYNGGISYAVRWLDQAATIDAVRVVRCQQCKHSEPFESNCELNTGAYLHCGLGRGEETRNVWHKYKKYYRDYSIVDRDGFCDSGERMEKKDGAE